MLNWDLLNTGWSKFQYETYTMIINQSKTFAVGWYQHCQKTITKGTIVSEDRRIKLTNTSKQFMIKLEVYGDFLKIVKINKVKVTNISRRS